jgi:type I site-specific restriction endonuclease
VSTLQTLELCYDKFSPADFDLIISDECHRSIYNKFTDVLAYWSDRGDDPRHPRFAARPDRGAAL